MKYERRYVTITGKDYYLRIFQIAEETGLDANLVEEKVKELFREAEERGDLKDGQLVVGYIAQVLDIKEELESMALKLQYIADKMCYVEDLLLPAKPECPQYIERLHPYRKHGGHGKPNYWHRIRSNPRQR